MALSMVTLCSIIPWYVVNTNDYCYLIYPWGYIRKLNGSDSQEVTFELSSTASKLFMFSLSLTIVALAKIILNRGKISFDIKFLMFTSGIMMLASAIAFQNFMIYLALFLRGTYIISYGMILAYFLSLILPLLASRLRAELLLSVPLHLALNKIRKVISEELKEVRNRREVVISSTNIMEVSNDVGRQ